MFKNWFENYYTKITISENAVMNSQICPKKCYEKLLKLGVKNWWFREPSKVAEEDSRQIWGKCQFVKKTSPCWKITVYHWKTLVSYNSSAVPPHTARGTQSLSFKFSIFTIQFWFKQNYIVSSGFVANLLVLIMRRLHLGSMEFVLIHIYHSNSICFAGFPLQSLEIWVSVDFHTSKLSSLILILVYSREYWWRHM